MDKHRMWSHATRGGVYEVIGVGVVKSGHTLPDMVEVAVTRTGQAWADLDVFHETDTISLTALVATATVQVNKGETLKANDQVVVYRDTQAKYWVRPVKDFYDGRFQKLDDNLQPLVEEKPAEEKPVEDRPVASDEAAAAQAAKVAAAEKKGWLK